MDKLFIRQLKLPVIIGQLSEERHWPQSLLLDLAVAVDFSEVKISDDLADTVNYVSLREAIIKFSKQKEWHLIETLAAQLADYLLAEFQLPWLQLTIRKHPAALTDLESVAVTVERHDK